jgi:putative ABC transport system permease protein
MIKDFFIFSVKSLRKRKLRSWLTMIGIFIGIAAVVSLIGLGEGLRTAINSQFGFLGTDILSIQAAGLAIAGPPGMNSPNPLSDDLTDKIRKVRGVESVVNRYIETGSLEFNDVQAVGMAMSYAEGDERKVFETMLNLEVEDGRLLKDGDGKKVLLGNNFKEDDMFGKGIKAGDRILVNELKFEVVGILEKKGSFIFDSAVIINEGVLLDGIREDDGTVNIIAAKVKDVDDVEQVKEDIEKMLRKERGVKESEEDFVVESPQQLLETLDSTLFAIQLFIIIIALISLVVGGIGIMNTMYTSVVERTKEIGIMKSIGAKNSTVFILFFIESGLLGMVGGVIGVVLGLIFAYGLAFIGKLALGSDLIQAQVSLVLIIGSLLFSFILGTLFGVLPAYQASKLQPVESLRNAK